jgi:hypothetical protein
MVLVKKKGEGNMSRREQYALTGRIQNLLWDKGIKCDCYAPFQFSTDKPIHEKSVNVQSQYSHTLSEPWHTKLTPAKAQKFYEKLKNGGQ